MCMHVCMRAIALEDAMGGDGGTQVGLGSVSQLCAFLLQFSQNPVITTSWRHHLLSFGFAQLLPVGKPGGESCLGKEQK